MAYDEQMVRRFRSELVSMLPAEVHEKQMFGALGFMTNGKVFACVGDKDVMYKLGAERCNELIVGGIAEPVIMGKRVMKDWVNVYFAHIEDKDKFNEYLSQSLSFATD